MAQQKQKSTAESKAKAAATRAQNKRRAEFHRQLRAVTQLLFGVFLLCCMIAGLIAPERPIGGAVGEWIRALLLGLFGLSAFLLPCALIYAGLLNAFGKKDKSYGAKKTAAFVLTIALSGAVHLLAPDVQGTGWAMVEELFAQGQQALGSGGVVGGLLSAPSALSWFIWPA